MQKKGGIFLTGILILIIVIGGLYWIITNMNVDTDVNVDFSRKETVVNQKASVESVRCLKDGFSVELELIGEEVEAYCVDENENRCLDENYYSGACVLTKEENNSEIRITEQNTCGNGVCEVNEKTCVPCAVDCGICEDEENCQHCEGYECPCSTTCPEDCPV